MPPSALVVVLAELQGKIPARAEGEQHIANALFGRPLLWREAAGQLRKLHEELAQLRVVARLLDEFQ